DRRVSRHQPVEAGRPSLEHAPPPRARILPEPPAGVGGSSDVRPAAAGRTPGRPSVQTGSERSRLGERAKGSRRAGREQGVRRARSGCEAPPGAGPGAPGAPAAGPAARHRRRPGRIPHRAGRRPCTPARQAGRRGVARRLTLAACRGLRRRPPRVDETYGKGAGVGTAAKPLGVGKPALRQRANSPTKLVELTPKLLRKALRQSRSTPTWTQKSSSAAWPPCWL